jgi:peptide/nickel transport system substrate-binding protein
MDVIRGGYKDDTDGVFNGWTTGADSGFWLERMFGGSQQPPRGVNRGWYQNASVDALFAQARAEVDETQRIKLYQQAADLISADAPWIFLYQDRLPRMFRKRVTGMQPAPSDFWDYTALAVN